MLYRLLISRVVSGVRYYICKTFEFKIEKKNVLAFHREIGDLYRKKLLLLINITY